MAFAFSCAWACPCIIKLAHMKSSHLMYQLVSRLSDLIGWRSCASFFQQAPIMSQEFQGSISSPTLSGSSAGNYSCVCYIAHMDHECFPPTATEHMKKSMIHCQHTQSGPSRSIWQITLKQAEYILTYKPDGTFLVWEESQEPSYLSSSSINTHVLSYM